MVPCPEGFCRSLIRSMTQPRAERRRRVDLNDQHMKAVGLATLVPVLHAVSAPLPEYPLHKDPGVIVITRDVTQPRRGQIKQVTVDPAEYRENLELHVRNEVVTSVPCERISLDAGGIWKSHQHGGAVARAADGTLYAWFRPVLFTSTDQGRTWTQSKPQQKSGPGAGGYAPVSGYCPPFTILADGSFVTVSGGNNAPLVVFRSADRGWNWEQVGEIAGAPFPTLYSDGNLLCLRDGSLVLPVQFEAPWADLSATWESRMWNQSAQYMMRSFDGGRTWRNAPSPALWRPLLENHLTTVTVSPQGRTPGPGGTFPGCWETGIVELADGDILAALRYSGRRDPWHRSMADRWNALVGDPGPTGRIYRHVMLARSHDGGTTWNDFGPVADSAGEPLLIYGESNGELIQLPDGRVVLIHQRRYPRSQEQLIARISDDGGRTWLPDEYRLMAGFGYPSSLALEDGTIITVSSRTALDTSSAILPGEKPGALAIRWKPLPRETKTP